MSEKILNPEVLERFKFAENIYYFKSLHLCRHIPRFRNFRLKKTR